MLGSLVFLTIKRTRKEVTLDFFITLLFSMTIKYELHLIYSAVFAKVSIRMVHLQATENKSTRYSACYYFQLVI